MPSALALRIFLLWLANRWVDAWEQRWAWVFPAWFLFFKLEVVKPPPGAPAEGSR